SACSSSCRSSRRAGRSRCRSDARVSRLRMLPRTLSTALLLAGAGGVLAFAALACEDDPHLRTPPGKPLGGGGACEAKPGELPAPDCDSSSRVCVPTPGCEIDEAR